MPNRVSDKPDRRALIARLGPLAAIAGVLFFCEAAAMVALDILGIRGVWGVVLDPIFLSLLATPLLLWILLAGQKHAAQRKQTADEIANLAKFPSENPNPVLRIASDGVVLYGNEASRPLLAEWESREGEPLPRQYRESLADALATGQSRQVDAQCGERLLLLTLAPVVASEYINVYAIDVTERRRAAEEARLAREKAECASEELIRKAKELEAARRASLNLVEDLEVAGAEALATNRQLEDANRLLEQAIERANLMAEGAHQASKAKSEFLANMSHEIRTPMTAILGYADLLTDATLTAGDREDYLAIIRRNGRHLLGLINDILDLSKIEAGKLTIQMRPTRVASVVADVASIMRVRAEEKRIFLSVEYTGELPETILTDKARFAQALVNLVGNAVKFTETGGVRMMVAFLSDWRGQGPGVQIQVVDSGIGIPADRIDKLFEPFVQVDASTSRKYGGTGLGLAITRHIAELLGGELAAESTIGQGSTFTLTVPTGPLDGVVMIENPAEVVQAKQTAQDSRGNSDKDLRGLKILLAEDGPDNQRLITALLCRAGAEVEVAENGQVAVEMAIGDAATRFDVILMDMQMPEMDGYEATRALRERGLTRPIIALTAHSMSGDREKCLSAGCTDYCSKPIHRSELIAAIARHAVGAAAGTEDRGAEAIRSELADDPVVGDILDAFVAGLTDRLEAMQQAAMASSYRELQREAHQLKGAGGGYGYPSLSVAAGALEDAAKDRDPERANLALHDVRTLCQAITAGHGAKVGLTEAQL